MTGIQLHERRSNGIDWKMEVNGKIVTVMLEILAEIKQEDLVTGT